MVLIYWPEALSFHYADNKIKMALSEASESELRLFHRLNQYVEQNHVELLEFWQSTRLCLTF